MLTFYNSSFPRFFSITATLRTHVTIVLHPPLPPLTCMWDSDVPLEHFRTPFSCHPLPFSLRVTNRQASSIALLLCSHQLVSSDWHAQRVSSTDLPACVAFLLKFRCQIPNEESVAGSAGLAGLSRSACLMKKIPVGFIIKEEKITAGEGGVMWGELTEMVTQRIGEGGTTPTI